MFECVRNPALHQMHTSPSSLCWKFHLQCGAAIGGDFGGSVSHGDEAHMNGTSNLIKTVCHARTKENL